MIIAGDCTAHMLRFLEMLCFLKGSMIAFLAVCVAEVSRLASCRRFLALACGQLFFRALFLVVAIGIS